MEILCTRPGCPRPVNSFADLDDSNTLSTVQQKFCISCGMPLILVGRYLPIKRLGQGGFGTAYLARDRYTPGMRRCVVKQFQPSGDLSPQQMQLARQLFEREAEVLEQLGNNHPQIPDLFAFFPLEVPGGPHGQPMRFFYLVQEFIDGQNLEEELAQKGKFSEAEVLEVLTEILKILTFVHSHHSIHRDIKPANIMRERTGKLVLLDFGAVKQVAQGAGNLDRSTGIYSMGFAPPEQMAGSTVFPSTDLYALAVTCIYLLTGKPASDLFDSYKNQWNWRPYAKVSKKLAEVLDKMLQASPSARFQSAEEVLQILTPMGSKNTPTGAKTLPVNVTQAPPTSIKATKRKFSSLEILFGAAFTGFEGGLLFIALGTLLPTPGIVIGGCVAILALLIFAQNRRFIEGKDLPIIAVITGLIVWFSPLRGGLALDVVLIASVGAALSAVAVTALFRLVYVLVARIF